MTVSLIPYEALKAKCITYSKPHLWRLEKANKFPKRVPIGAGRYGYVEEEIDGYIAQKIAERDARSRMSGVAEKLRNPFLGPGSIESENKAAAGTIKIILPGE